MTVMFLDDFQPQIAQQFSEFFAAKLQTADTSIVLFSIFSKFFDKDPSRRQVPSNTEVP